MQNLGLTQKYHEHIKRKPWTLFDVALKHAAKLPVTFISKLACISTK